MFQLLSHPLDQTCSFPWNGLGFGTQVAPEPAFKHIVLTHSFTLPICLHSPTDLLPLLFPLVLHKSAPGADGQVRGRERLLQVGFVCEYLLFICRIGF